MGGAEIQTAIVLGRLGIPLYPTFNDPEFALNTVKTECSEVINELKTVYGLNDFSDNHLDEYNRHMYAHLDNENKSEWYDEFNDQFVELSNYFDMYENLDLNHYLVSTAASAKSIPELLSDENFLTTLPYFAIDDLIEKDIIERDEDVGGFPGKAGTKIKKYSGYAGLYYHVLRWEKGLFCCYKIILFIIQFL